MASNHLNNPVLWDIRVSSRKNLTQANRDFIVELMSEEARKAPSGHSFILHDAIESANYCRLLVEATKPVLAKVRRTLKANLPHKITAVKLNSRKN
jgi:hypothetical protein